MELSVIIPVFNEKESLPILFEELQIELKKYNDWEIIFIDDGSSDGSAEYIQELVNDYNHIKLIKFYKNFGKSAALSEGFKESKGDLIFTMDADLQDDPIEITNLINKLNEGFDLVSGWKKKRNDPLSKTLPSKLFNFITRFFTGVQIHDFNCGLKGYRKAVVKTLDIYGGRHRYIPALAAQKEFKISEIIVNHRERMFGETKYGGSRFLHGFFDLLTILFLNKYTQQPLHLFGFFGLVSSVFGLFAEIIVLYYKIYLGEPFANHLALLIFGVMLITIGIQFFSIGLLGEMMAKSSQNQENRVKNIIKSKA